MQHVRVRSRSGNLLLFALGAIYAVGGLAVLVLFVVDVWQAIAVVDLLLQMLLIAATGCGIWFVAIAMQNLGIRISTRRRMPYLVHR